MQLYGFQVFTSLPKKGKEGFSNIGVVHCICIIKDAVTPNEKYHQIIHLKNEDNEIVMDNIVFHLIELAKFSIAKKEINKVKTDKEELLYTMKYAHKFDPSKDELPAFWGKDYFKRPLKRLDTSRMTPFDAAIYKNMLIRVEAAENIVDKQIRQAVEAAKQVAEQAKLASIKKLLLRGKATIEEIAEDFEVSIEFVKNIDKSLKNA